MSSKLIQKAACPNCQALGRDNHEDNLAVYDDGHSYCFACQYYSSPTNRTGDLLDYSFQYLPWRGISINSFQHYGVLTKCDAEGKPISLGYVYPNGDIQVRLLDQKEFFWVKKEGSHEKPGLFGRDKFEPGCHESIIVTEGALDAITCYQTLGKVPAVSVQSASSAVADCTRDRSYLNQFRKIYLAFDGDAPGRDAVAAVARLFDYDKVYVVKFTNRKDPNEFLQHGEATDLLNVWKNSKRYLPESLTSSLDDFDKILSEAPKYGIPYPFPSLTKMTYGIRTGETVLITAQEGVGKTEIMHALEYQLLKETEENVGAIFLEEPAKRHLQALAGLHLKAPVHLPDAGYSSAQVSAAVRDLVRKDERLHVHLYFGSDDADVLLEILRFLSAARKCKYILFDHVSMAASGMAEQDERRFLDYFVTKAQTMVKELDFGLIIVSHVNDQGQTRGSRYIGKIADIRIDATRDVLDPDPIARNTTHLNISKNRYSGKTGPACKLAFDHETFTLSEIPDVFNAANDNGILAEVGQAAA